MLLALGGELSPRMLIGNGKQARTCGTDLRVSGGAAGNRTGPKITLTCVTAVVDDAKGVDGVNTIKRGR
jgi:hypothetical protein